METPNQKSADDLQYQTKLNIIYKTVHEEDSFEKVLPLIEKNMLELLQAERLTVYQCTRQGREIVSKFKTGDEIKEIRVPLSPTSIAGYVALSKKSIRIDDVYNKDLLKQIHPELKFDDSYDRKSGFRTRSMIVVPIKVQDTLLGVLQVINRAEGGACFTDTHLSHALELAHVIAQKFQYEMQATKSPFDYLLRRKKITPEQLEEAGKKAEEKKCSVSAILISEYNLFSHEVGESLEHYYQIPFMPYDPEITPPSDLLKNLKMVYLRKNRWVPVSGNTEKAVILIDDPNDSSRIMDIQQILKVRNYEFRVGFTEDILRYLGVANQAISAASSDSDLEELLGRMQDTGDVVEESEIGDSGSVDENEAAVVQLVNRLIVDAQKINASDIHIEPSKGRDSAVVRMRVDGVCRKVLEIPASYIRAVTSRIKIISKLDIAERRKPQDGKISAKFKGQPIELRVATLPTVNGESAVLRVLAASGALPMDKLNFSKRNDEETKRLIEHPHGIFLVVGPTGSGKTTTLHAVLGHINTPERKIWTAEDPVEITQPGLQQVQVDSKIGFTFAHALRAFLRADPDVILIGEMRDKETAHIGVEASLTGHLVFSTLHTNSAPETITRLLDLGLDPLNFADALLGVLAQRLVRTLCSNCKQPYKATEHECEQIVRAYGEEYFPELGVDLNNLELYKPVGCEKCGKTGYRGRTGIHELLVSSPEMKQAVAKASEVSAIKNIAVKEGMRTLIQDGVWKILKGDTDLVQLHRVTVE